MRVSCVIENLSQLAARLLSGTVSLSVYCNGEGWKSSVSLMRCSAFLRLSAQLIGEDTKGDSDKCRNDNTES